MHSNNAAFRRLTIDCVISGGTRISWELNPHMIDAGTYVYQLQFSNTGLDDSSEWINVGSPESDTYYLIDSEQRTWGKTLDPHYRVKLTTDYGAYYSEPESCDGKLSKRDWLTAREIIRKELLRHSVLTSPDGYLLKVRRYGPRCTVCSDEFTEEVSRTNCATCFGTGFENGYFEPMPACYADVGLHNNREHRDPNKGMNSPDVIQARFIGDTQIYSYDVWINKTSDERYYIHTVKSIAAVRGVTVIYDVEMRVAPFSDVIYTLPLDGSFLLASKKKWTKPKVQKPTLNYIEAAINERKVKRKTR